MTTPPFQPLPCDDGAGGSGPGLDVEQNVLCDYDAEGNVVGSALAVYEYDAETGNPTGPPTFVDPATGDPYVPLGTLRPCGTTPGVAQVYAACEDVPREAIVTGPNLIDNGDFADSEGIGATSTAGPGFTTAYTFPSPCDDIFTACGGAGSMAYFNTNAGQVAGSGSYPSANSIQALTTKSLAVNVGPDTTQPIICWQVALVSGREYELSADVAIINEPYSVKLTIDGVDVLPLTAPASTGQWQRRSDRFVWSGSTGLHSLCLASNSGVAAGNDHAFDNFSLREVTASQDAVLSDCEYDSRVRACIEHVVQIVGCNDDRRDAILANIAAAAGGGPANSVVVDRICVGGETWARVTLYETGAGSVVDTRYFGPDGVLQAAPATFTQGDCNPQTPGQSVEVAELCDVDDAVGTSTRFLRAYVYPDGSSVPITSDTLLDGVTPYVVQGTVGPCEPCASTVTTLRLCDLNPDVEPDDEGRRCATPFLRALVYDCAGELIATRDTTTDGVTPYTPVEVVDCECGAGGSVPSLVELIWPQTDVVADPDGVADHDFLYLLTNPQTGETAQVRLNTVTAPTAGTCGAWTPGNNVSVNAPAGNPSGNSRFTFTLDAAAQQMSSFRLDFIDLDPFEGVRSLTPPPDRVEFSVGAGTWTPGSGNISATASNSTAHAYWDNPPTTITHLYANNGGGIACHAAALQGVTLIPGECCDGSSSAALVLGEVCYDAGGGVTRTASAVRCAGCADTAVTYVDLETGVAVDASALVACPPETTCPTVLGTICYSPPVVVPDQPLAVTGLTMTGAAFNDAAGENVCNISPAPSTSAGWVSNASGPGCLDPVTGAPSLGWAGPLQALTWEYGNSGDAAADGGVIFNYTSAETGPITWPANNTRMTPGETRTSNLLTGGRYARLTYVSGPTGTNAPFQPGGAGISVHFASVANLAPIALRLEFFGPGGVAAGDVATASVVRACDGTISYIDLATGTELDTSAVTFGPCPDGTADEQPTQDVETVELCDVAGNGTVTRFLRALVYPAGATVPVVVDTLDGVTPYTPTGTVGACSDGAAGADVETFPLCVIDNVSGNVIQNIRGEVVYDAAGVATALRYVDAATGGPVALPGGTHIDVCPDSVADDRPVSVLEQCRCDDTDGDGIGDVEYVELLAVADDGTLTTLGTYTSDLTGPYSPGVPAPCPVDGADPLFALQARRVTLAPGETWDAAAWPRLQSVTLLAATGTGTVTDAAGPSTLFEGESATWGIGKPDDLEVRGPLTITADPGGTVSVVFTVRVPA